MQWMALRGGAKAEWPALTPLRRRSAHWTALDENKSCWLATSVLILVDTVLHGNPKMDRPRLKKANGREMVRVAPRENNNSINERLHRMDDFGGCLGAEQAHDLLHLPIFIR